MTVHISSFVLGVMFVFSIVGIIAIAYGLFADVE